jgi:hypothetical protein
MSTEEHTMFMLLTNVVNGTASATEEEYVSVMVY